MNILRPSSGLFSPSNPHYIRTPSTNIDITVVKNRKSHTSLLLMSFLRQKLSLKNGDRLQLQAFLQNYSVGIVA
jgi:hypothetical protein